MSLPELRNIKNKKENIIQPQLFIVFKYLSIGTGIAGIGILIAILGFLLTQH